MHCDGENSTAISLCSCSCYCLQFIYISREEMAAVAAFIKQRGRVAIAELAARSDELIDLEQKAGQLPAGLAGDVDDLFSPNGGGDAAPSLVDVTA